MPDTRTAMAVLAAVLLSVTAPGAPAEAGSKRHVLFESYCEFTLGQPVPANAVKITTVKITADGETRVYQHYRTCRGKSDALIELQGGVVDTITVTRRDACIARLACVGEAYGKVARRYARNGPLNSEAEGRNVSLIASSTATIVFNVQATPSRCFKGPKCGPELKPQIVTRLYLHR